MGPLSLQTSSACLAWWPHHCVNVKYKCNSILLCTGSSALDGDMAATCQAASLPGGHTWPLQGDQVLGHPVGSLSPILAGCDFLSANTMLHEDRKEMYVCKKSLFPVEIMLKIIFIVFIVVMIA